MSEENPPTPSGFIRLTPELAQSIGAAINDRQADIDARYPSLVRGCPYETKLAVTAWVFEALIKNAEEGGSFRHLIYDHLGFNTDAYHPLYVAGGQTITNEFSLRPIPKED